MSAFFTPVIVTSTTRCSCRTIHVNMGYSKLLAQTTFTNVVLVRMGRICYIQYILFFKMDTVVTHCLRITAPVASVESHSLN